MKERVVTLLTACGVTVEQPTDPLLDVLLEQVRQRILNDLHRSELPAELEGVAVSMTVGEYLSWKKSTGQLDGLEPAVKSIQEGDTNITYALGEGSQTPEQRLDSLIDRLLHGREDELRRFRRVAW